MALIPTYPASGSTVDAVVPAALFGCYELNCFSRAKPGPDAPSQLQP